MKLKTLVSVFLVGAFAPFAHAGEPAAPTGAEVVVTIRDWTGKTVQTVRGSATAGTFSLDAADYFNATVDYVTAFDGGTVSAAPSADVASGSVVTWTGISQRLETEIFVQPRVAYKNFSTYHMGDPWIVKNPTADVWYVTSTKSSDGLSIYKTTVFPTNQFGYSRTGYNFRQHPQDVGAYTNFIWAPEMHYIQGRWYAYLSASSSAASSNYERPFALWLDGNDPYSTNWKFGAKLVTPGGDRWAIDGTILDDTAASGKLYYIWSGWPSTANGVQNLYIAEMSSPTSFVQNAERILLSTPTEAWETLTTSPCKVNEGPVVLRHGNAVHIVYSCNGCWTDDYSLALLTCTDGNFTNPSSWTKSTKRLFVSRPGAYGPGHCSFTRTADGQDMIVYHAKAVSGHSSDYYNYRDVRMQPIAWHGDEPVFGAPRPYDSTLTSDPLDLNADYSKPEVPGPKPVPISPAFDAAHTIICYGDSLTEGTCARTAVHASLPNYFDGRLDGVSIEEGYPYWLSTMATNGYNVIAQALAGATADIILGWQGASVLKTTLPLTLPAAANEYVPLGTNLLFNGNDGGYMYIKRGVAHYFGFLAPLYPLVGAIPHDGTNYITASEGAMSGWLNGVHVRIKGRYPAFDGKPYQTICRTEAASAETKIPLGTRFVSDAAITYSNAIQVICAGANDGAARMTDAVFPLLEAAAQVAPRHLFVSPVLSVDTDKKEKRGQTADTAVEKLYAARFGDHYLNSRQQLRKRGLSLAVRLGLMTPDEAAATTWDAKDGLIATDNVHLNTTGYAVKAYLVYEKLVQLGYVQGELLPPDPTDYGATDSAAATYTWKGFDGPWEYTTNWTWSDKATYGIPSQGTYATASFPATLTKATACTLTSNRSVKKALFNSPNLTFTIDNATLTVNGYVDTTTTIGAYNFGNTATGNPKIVFRGAKPGIVETTDDFRSNFGYVSKTADAEGLCTVRFEVPAANWATAPIRSTKTQSKICFWKNVAFEVDATALSVPSSGTTTTVPLATAPDGVHFMLNNFAAITSRSIIMCAPGAKGTVSVANNTLLLTVTKDDGNEWADPPSLATNIFTAGASVAAFAGTPKNGTAKANYTADQLASLEPGCYTYRATATAEGYAPLVKEIDFVVLKKDFDVAHTIVCYGDSITAGYGATATTADGRANFFDGRMKGVVLGTDTLDGGYDYPYYLSGLVPTNYNVISQAKSAMWTDTILAWQGGVDVVSRREATLPAGGAGVWCPTNICFTVDNPYGIDGGLQAERDKYFRAVQTNYLAGLSACTLPCIETFPTPCGKWGTMSGWFGDKHVRVYGTAKGHPAITGKEYGTYTPDQMWARIGDANTASVTIPAGTPFVPDSARIYGDAITVIFSGTNDGTNNYETFIPMIAKAVAKIPSGRYVVVSSQAPSARSDKMEAAFAAAFGEHHLNLHAMMETNGLKTAVALKLMSQAEAAAAKTWFSKAGLVADDLHPNSKGYRVIATFLKEKLESLGYIPTTPPEPETPDVTLESLLAEMCDADAATRLPTNAWTGRLWSSYDRASVSPDDPATWYANNDRSQFVATNVVEGRTECVMVDAKGPGVLTRLWTANGYGTVYRFYVDGASEPVISGVGTNLIGGHVLCGAPLAEEVAPGQKPSLRAQDLYLPIPFAQSLVVTAELKDIPPDDDKAKSIRLWYNAEVRTYAAGVRVESFSTNVLERAQGAIAAANAALASPPAPTTDETLSLDGTLAAGASRSVTFTRTGAIRSLALKLAGDGEPLRTVRVLASFDGEKTVDAAAGQLFGAGYAATAYATVDGGVDADGTMTLREVMPFKTSCTVTLTNTSASACTVSASAVAVGAYEWDDARSLHFGACGFEERDLPTRRGAAGYYDLNWVRLEGKGFLVGNTLTVDNSQSAQWWGEGDEKIYVDGEAFPSYFGTGTEDFFGYAWSSDKPFANHPFLSLPLAGGDVGGRRLTTAKRVRRLDAVPFAASLKLDVEVWHWADCAMDYAPATFWYARPGVRVTPGGLEPESPPPEPEYDPATDTLTFKADTTYPYATDMTYDVTKAVFEANASLLVTNGAKVTVNKAYLGASGNVFTAKEKATLTMTPFAASQVADKTWNFNLDAGYVYLNEKWTFQATDTLNVTIANGGYLAGSSSVDLMNGIFHFDLTDSTIKFNSYDLKTAGTSVRLNNTTVKSNWAFTMGTSGSQTLELAGAAPQARGANGALSIGANTTVTLRPELTWSATVGRLHSAASTTASNAKITLALGAKLNVDVTKLAGGMPFTFCLLSAPNTPATRSITLPATSAVTVSGTGRENCSVEFTKSSDDRYVYVTVTSTEPAKPYYNKDTGGTYATAQEALDAARPGETVKVSSNPSAMTTIRMKPGVIVDTQGFSNVTLAADPWFDTIAVGTSYAIQLNGQATPTVADEGGVPGFAIDGTTVRIHAKPLCSNLWYGVGMTNALGAGPFPVETWRQVKQGDALDFELTDQPAAGRFYQIQVKDRE